MRSYWDMLPEDICIEIYRINHTKYMNDIIISINNANNQYSLHEYYSDSILNYWYIGSGLNALKPMHWGNIHKHHKRYNGLYHSSYNKTY